MNLTPLRTAAIAGTCAIALSFISIPAFADEVAPADQSASDTSVQMPSDSSSDPATDDSAPTPTPTETAPALPAEKGKPREHLKDATLSPAAFLKHGVTATFTGLTPHAKYQAGWGSPAMGDDLGSARTATAEGTLTVVWKPGKTRDNEPGSIYFLGLHGLQTDYSAFKQIDIKLDSDLVWKPATRSGKKVTLTAVADHAKASGKGDTAWKKVEVDFQKKVGHKWVTVKADKTNSKGVATATIKSGKHVWRAIVTASATVFGSTTKGHKK